MRIKLKGLFKNKFASIVGHAAELASNNTAEKISDYKLENFMRHYLGQVVNFNKNFACDSQNQTRTTAYHSIKFYLKDIKSINTQNSIGSDINLINKTKKFDKNQIFDNGTQETKRVYKYLLDPSKSFLVSLVPIEGNVKLYANPLLYPNSLDNSIWKLDSPLSKRLIISNEEVKKYIPEKSNKKQWIYFVVESEKNTNFLLTVKEFDPELYDSSYNGNIEIGLIEADQVKKGKLKTYH